jgi:4-hydroxy-tetrahydrodipicolinate synthase
MMKNIDLTRFDTVQLVPPTPFSLDGREVNGERLAALVTNLEKAGIRVFLPAAGTGEFHSLSVDEVVLCVRATRAAVSDSCTVVAPIGLSVEHAVAIGKRALDAGADALLLMPVIHPYVSDEGFRDYFLAISDRVGMPLITYKRGPAPSDKLLLELAREGKLCGVKYAVNDLDTFARFAAAAQSVGNLGLYCGTAERWAPYFMLAGATGYTSGSGSVAPRTSLAMHRALRAGNNQEALRLLAYLRPLEDYRSKDSDSFNISAMKSAVSMLGNDFGPCRPPQRQLTLAEQSDLRRIVESLLDAEKNISLSV